MRATIVKLVDSSGAGVARNGWTCLSVSGCILLAAGTVGLTPAQAQGGSIKTLFEKYNLLGTFAWDCSKPASNSNIYYVQRLIDADHVQRDQISGPTNRDWSVVLDRAAEVRPNEIAGSGILNGRVQGRDFIDRPASAVWRVEPNRMLQWEGVVDGQMTIKGGQVVSNGFALPWSSRCPDAGAETAAAEPMRLDVDGRQRTYLLARPAGQVPRPTIIMLHGLNGDGARIAEQTGLDRVAPGHGFAAAFPDRQPPLQGWNFFPHGKEPEIMVRGTQGIGGPPNDAGFVKALVADLVRRGISDPKRIYLAGVSNGSFMALRVICADAAPFAAVALLVGGMPEVVGEECRPSRPMPVLMLNGTADASVPYAGGPVQPFGIFSAWPTERLVAFFRGVNGCSESHDDSLLNGAGPKKVEVTRWPNCDGGQVLFYRVVGGDHGAWSGNADVARLLVDFFRDKARNDAR
jgi:polyhydroxybutyrate depolymerase